MRFLSMFLRWGVLVCFGSCVVVACKRDNTSPAKPDAGRTTSPTSGQSSAIPSPVEVRQKALQQKASAVIGATFKSLSGRLQQAIAQGGIVQAVQVCSTQAIPLTEAAGKPFQATVTRVSHRPRNLNNTANTQELQVIQSYIAALGKGGPIKPVVVEKTGQPSVVYAPILLAMPLCLQCHGAVGTQIKDADYEAIKKLYPQDQAINFKMGELRGLWKISFAQNPPVQR